MDVVTSHSEGGGNEYSDQPECISSQPRPGRPHPLQCEGTDSLSAAPPPLPPRTNKKSLSSSKSHTSFRTNASLIEEVAGDDCCVHCLLGCLFCELPSMCWAAEKCVTCGDAVSSCCGFVDTCCSWCCCCCWDEACTASLDCGLLAECCSSADCLEICLECCAICFPS